MTSLTEQLWGSLLIAQVVKAARQAPDDHAARKVVAQVVREFYAEDFCPECGPGRPGVVDDPQGPAGDPASITECSTCARNYPRAGGGQNEVVDAHESSSAWVRRMQGMGR